MPELQDARVVIGVPGLNGDVTGSATLGDHETRIAAVEADIATVAALPTFDTTGATAGDFLVFDGTDWVPGDETTHTPVTTIPRLFEGGGAPIPVANYYGFYTDVALTITGWTLAADVSTTSTIGVWIDTYANFPPVLADEKFTMTLTAATKNQNNAISIAVAAGSFVYYNLGANNNATVLMASIRATRTV